MRKEFGELTYEELGHMPDGKAAGFCFNYYAEDIGGPVDDLTCTLLGYELEEHAIEKLQCRFAMFLGNCREHKRDKK